MSVDYNSILVVGIPVKWGDLLETRVIPSCEHDVKKEVKYCPSVGRRWGKVSKTDYKPFLKGMDDGEPTVGGLVIKCGHSFIDLNPMDLVYISCLATRNNAPENGEKPLDLAALPWFEEKAKKVLEPLGLWNAKKFGIYHLLECSY